jgi:hypothetical protein
MKYVYVQSVLPQEDVIALKQKSGESSVKRSHLQGSIPLFKV